MTSRRDAQRGVGASHPSARRAAERGSGTLALTDPAKVTGAVRFAKAAAAAGVRPVLGVDLAVAPHEIAATQRRRTPVRGGAHVVEAPLRVTFLG